MYLLTGRDAIDVPAGSERIAFASPLDDAAIDELRAGEQAMIDEIAAFGIVLSPDGERLVADGAFGLSADELVDASFDPVAMVGDGLAAELVLAGALQLDASVAGSFERTSQLRREVAAAVAVFVRPT